MWGALCVSGWAVPGAPTPAVTPTIPDMQLPNEAWSRIQGEVVRPIEGGLWFARTNGLMPVGSVLSVRRNGVMINGGRVVESDRKGIFFHPWAGDAIQPGDTLNFESVAPNLP